MPTESTFDETTSSHQIRRGAVLSYLSIGFQILAGLLYTPWLIRQLGQSDYAIYTLMASISGALMIDLGLRHVVPRFVAKYRAEGDDRTVNDVVGIAVLLYVAIDLIIVAVLLILYLNLASVYQQLTPAEIDRLRVVYVVVGLYSVVSFPFATLNGLLGGYEKFVQLKACDLLQKAASVGLAVVALLGGYGLVAVVTANAVAGLAASALKLLFVLRYLPVRPHVRLSGTPILKAILAFSLWTGLANIASEWIFNTTPSILARVSGSMNVAVFGVASALEGYVFLVANPISELFLPRVTRIVRRDDGNTVLLDLMVRVGRLQLAVVGFLIVLFLSVGQHFLDVWVGEEYAAVYPCAVLLILPASVFVPQLIASQAILALDKVRLQALVYLAMAVINVGLALLLAPRWGAFGASVAIFITYLLRDVAMNAIYIRAARIDVWIFFRRCHGGLALPLLVSMLVGFAIDGVLPPSGLLVLALKCALIAIVYAAILWRFGANGYEKGLVLAGLRRLTPRIHGRT